MNAVVDTAVMVFALIADENRWDSISTEDLGSDGPEYTVLGR